MAAVARKYEKIAEKYARAVVGGKVLACAQVRQACHRHLSDLEQSRAGESPYEFNPTLNGNRGLRYRPGERICFFTEQMSHVKGKWRGEKIRLEPWQVFCLCVAFGWVWKSTGLRRFREIYWEIPRKNAKSTLGAAIGLYMAFVDGEPGAEVYAGATTEKQAYEVFRPAWQMVDINKPIQQHLGLSLSGTEQNPGTIYQISSASRFEVVIGKPGDGASPHCSLTDEYHEHKSSEQYDTMKTGMGAREQPMQVTITTAGTNLAGPCYSLSNRVKKMLAGLNGFENDRLFGVIFTVDEGDDGDEWTDESALRKANPNYGVSVFPDYLKAQIKEACQDSAKQNTTKTKHLNLWCNAGTAYFNMEHVKAAADDTLRLDDFLGESCWTGVDLAAKQDMAAIIPTFRREIDGKIHIYQFCKLYCPEAATQGEDRAQYAAWALDGHLKTCPGARNDFNMFEDELEELGRQFQMEEIPHDPWNAAQLVQNMINKGAPMVEVPQTVNYLSEPLKEMKAAMADGTYHFDGNPVMTWMFSNVMAKPDKKDNLFPFKESEDQKIDGPIAAIMGMGRAMAGVMLEESSVYESRGALLF